MKSNRILIFAELSDSKLTPVFFELLTKAKELSRTKKSFVSCVLLGSKLDQALEEAKASGIDEIMFLDDDRLAVYNIDYYCAALSNVISKSDTDIFLFGATSIGEELAPTMGLKLKTGVAAHCMDIRFNNDGRLAQLVPAFGGKVVGEIFTPETRPQIVSVKPGILPVKSFEPNDNCLVIKLDETILNEVFSSIEAVSVTTVQNQGIDINKAEFIVCAGYGAAKSNIRDDLIKLSELCNGAVGYTRPAIDAGMASDESNMIGTSGKSVKPKVYLGVGVSGSTHHVCGMAHSDLIISINTDPNSEIFNISDYKVVGDGAAIIRELANLITLQRER